MLKKTLLFLLLLKCTWALSTVVVEVRECAGIQRVNEPVVLKGAALIPHFGKNVNVKTIQLTDEKNTPVLVQIDERDGGFGYTSSPNGKLDPDDEIVWQVTIGKLENKRYKLTTSKTSFNQDTIKKTDITAAPNSNPKHYSATYVMKNSYMEVGVRGWPVDKKKWSGAGAGDITLFKLFGKDLIAQGEGHQFILNNGNMFDKYYNKLELIAKGPVRAILQVTGSGFSGRTTAQYGRSFCDITNGRALRTYMLYNGIPWMEAKETLKGDRILPRFTADFRFHWRPGGRPFSLDTRMFIPNSSGDIDSFMYKDEKFGGTFFHLPNPWVFTSQPDKKGGCALFFDPIHTWRIAAWIVEPWMKKGFDNAQKFDRVKCVTDVTFHDPEVSRKNEASWEWAVWGTKTQDPVVVQTHYQAWMKRPLRVFTYTGAATMKIPDNAVQTLKKALVKGNTEKSLLAEFTKHTDKETVSNVEKHLSSMLQTVSSLLKSFQNWRQLNNKEKVDTVRKFQRWQTQSPNPLLAVQQFELFNKYGSKQKYSVFITSTYQKIFRNLRCPGIINAPVKMDVCRHEGESIQLGIVPYTQELEKVKIEISDLKSSEGIIPADAWKRYIIGDVKPPEKVNSDYKKPKDTRWPDPLLPYHGFNCPQNELRAVLLTLNVPVNAVPGQYKGTIRVIPENATVTDISVDVRVSSVVLPEKRTMLWDSWYDMDSVIRHYGEYSELKYFEKNMEMLSKFRAAPGMYGWAYMAPLFFKVWREKDGTFTFDFSQYDQWMDINQRWGNLWNPNGSCNSGWFSVFHSKHLWNVVRDRTTGKHLKLKDIPEKSKINPEYTLIYEKFMQAYVKHLKEKGWLSTGWLEKWDEPVRERVEPCKKHYAYLRKITPELQLFNWGMRPVTDDWGWGYTDAWAPNIHAWNKELDGIERARKKNIKVFAYTCGAGYSSPDRTQMTPDINIWDPNIQRRVYGWFYHHLGLDGMLIFTMTGWPKQSPNWGRKKAERWPNSDWKIKGYNTHYLVYPGPDGYMYPTLRLDALRDGFEDYELIVMAKEKLKNKPDSTAKKNLDTTDLITSIEVYEQEPAQYDKRKKSFLRYLEKK